MYCSSCTGIMRSTKTEVRVGSVSQEHRCPRCGNQLITSQLNLTGEPFDLDPFLNYFQLQRSNVTPTSSAEVGTESQQG